MMKIILIPWSQNRATTILNPSMIEWYSANSGFKGTVVNQVTTSLTSNLYYKAVPIKAFTNNFPTV